jgi:DNA polymerase III gamma/tau subunit
MVRLQKNLLSRQLLTMHRVEKYRPNSLDDVEGHKDIIATINKFVDSNVRSASLFTKHR